MKLTLHTRSPRRQRGAVLAIGLFFLVIITLIGVTAMSTSGLEIKMAANLKDWNMALQAMEAALRDAETDISTTGRVSGETNAVSGCATASSSTPELDGQCLTASGATQAVWRAIDWTDGASSKKYVIYGAKTGASGFSTSQGYAAQPRYIIEPIKTFKPGESLAFPKKATTMRITAVGYGGSTDASVMGQSTYVTP